MTKNTCERKPRVWWQDMGSIHWCLNPIVEAAQMTAELKPMPMKICAAADRGELREVQHAQIMDEECLA